MAEPKIDIQNLLQTGSFPTGRIRSSARGSSESLERSPRFYSGTNSSIDDPVLNPIEPEPSLRYYTPPPPPTVEDSEDLDGEYSEEQPKFKGDVDQHPVILENEDYQYAHNPEQRFVLVTDPTDPKRDPKVDERKNTEPSEQRFVLVSNPNDSKPQSVKPDEDPEARRGRPTKRDLGDLKQTDSGAKQTAAAAAATAGAAAAASKLSARGSSKEKRPSLNRRKSPHDLPQLDTETGGEPRRRASKHVRSRSSTSTYNDEYRYHEPPSPVYGGRPAQDDFLSPEVIKHGPRNREQAYYASSTHTQPSRPKERLFDERLDGPSYSRGPRSTSPAPRRSRPIAELPSKHTSRRSSRGSPPRPDILRGALSRRPESPPRRETRPRRHDGYSDEDVISDAPSSRRNPRKSVVVHDERASVGNLLTPLESRQMTNSRSRSRSTTVGTASPNLYAETIPHAGPRGPRSPGTFSSQVFDSPSVAPPYPTADFMPTQDSVNYHGGTLWDPRSRPRDLQGYAPNPIQINGPSGPREPVDSSRSRYPRQDWQHSPPRNQIQASPSNPFLPSASRPAPAQQLDTSVRKYFEDPRRSGLPALPPCPRKEPVAGMADWLTLPRCDNFNICPTCYTGLFANSPYRSHFIPAPWRPHDQKIACDIGSSLWYPIAWLLTAKNRLPDLRLLTGIADINWETTGAGQECPGEKRAARVWNTIKDPITRRAVPNFNVCYECTMIIEILLPNMRGILVFPESTSQKSSGQCSMHPSPDRQLPLLYFDALENASEAALASGGAPKVAQLAEDIGTISSRVARGGPGCSRDKPTQNQKWYIMASLPELTVCDDCFEDVVYPRLSESPNLVDQFSMYSVRLPVGTCQLYSDRMRTLFDESCRRKDARLLEDAVIERKNKEIEIQAKLDQLKGQPQDDPWVGEAVKKLEQLWKRWE
ncbi:hypothetical protein jhhlp_008723 [Lomentospora prolificans]|uniref:Uncharacterized protein n=1 Tax=Lomentospora prolificans TaxID=41688 RepID=A0A2N3MYU8_9PEZI|nr:hypothetical protein jhhlp_008723 [Lomentospora prolificans]